MDFLSRLDAIAQRPEPAAQQQQPLSRNVLIAVAWPYANGRLHVGHLAGYLIPADTVARYHRLRGNRVSMVSGSDCYGTPITLEAEKRGIPPGKLSDDYHEEILKLFAAAQIQFDVYTKTTSPTHHATVHEVFLRLLELGYIRIDSSQQFYSNSRGRFLPDRYVVGDCPKCGSGGARSDQCDNCGAVLSAEELLNPRSTLDGELVDVRDSQHYFLDWPKLQDEIKAWVDSQSSGWRPWVKAETDKWLAEGLRPRAITRDIEWGVPIPEDRIPEEFRLPMADQKRIYVWFEAVIGYLSATIEGQEKNDYDYRDFWLGGNALHYYFMGKDNLPFHTVFWPGQLMGLGSELHLPDVPAINQYMLFTGSKLSKSKGNLVDSKDLIEQYGCDAVRFYMGLSAPETNDSNFRMEDFVEKVNKFLVGKIGNFINRSLKLGGEGASYPDLQPFEDVLSQVGEALASAESAMAEGSLRGYTGALVKLADDANLFLTQQEPWYLKDSDPEKFAAVMGNAMLYSLGLAFLMKPLLPGAALRLEPILSVSLERWPESVSQVVDLAKSAKASNVVPLFERIQLPPPPEEA